MYLALFVNDGLIAAESSEILERVIEHLSGAFKITIGGASLYVSMQIERQSEKSGYCVRGEIGQQILEQS